MSHFGSSLGAHAADIEQAFRIAEVHFLQVISSSCSGGQGAHNIHINLPTFGYTWTQLAYF